MIKVKLRYFKQGSGKWYTDGEYESHIDEQPNAHIWMVCDEVRRFQAVGKAPGLSSGGKEFHVLVEVQGQCKGCGQMDAIFGPPVLLEAQEPCS